MATVESIAKTVIPAGRWKVDPVHSNLGFLVVDESEMMTTITGRFTEFDGFFEADESGEDARAEGVIQAASVTTDQPQRDAHLRSPDFFDAERYPEIRFETTAIEAVGEDRARLSGRLTIKEQPQDVALEGRLITGTGVQGEERIIFQSQGGLSWGPMSVDLTVSISAVKES